MSQFEKMLSLFLTFTRAEYKNVSCKVNADGVLEFKNEVDKSWDAYAAYDPEINKTGWYQLHVFGNDASDPHNMMR